MPVRGRKNPFPKKMKLQSNVFSTPQKMDKPPAALKKARAVHAGAMRNGNDKTGHGSTGASAGSVYKTAMASSRKNPSR